MASKISCRNPDCRAAFLVPEHLAGKRFRCRRCGHVTEIPRSLAASPDNCYELAEQKEIVAAPYVAAGPGLCPSCNSQLPANAVLCVSCGFNLQTGKKLSKATVTERKAKVVIYPSTALSLAAACYLGGAILMVVGLLIHPLLVLIVAAPAIGIAVLGFFLWKTTFAKVTVTKQGDQVVCDIAYYSFGFLWTCRSYFITAEDRMFMCHDTPPQVFVPFLLLLLVGIIPGMIWWRVLLAERSFLQIRNSVTGSVQNFSLFWGESDLRNLIETINEVEYVPVERG